MNDTVTGDPLLDMMTSVVMDMMDPTTTAVPTKRGYYNWYNELKNETHYSNAKWLDKHKHYVLLPVSFFGNLLCVIVLGKRARTSSAYLFMTNMAVWDAFVIMGKAFYMFMSFNYLNIGTVGCVILAYFVDTAPLIAVWLLVFMTVDRTVAIWFPFKHGAIFSVRNAAIACALLYIAIIALNCFHIWAEEGLDFYPFYYCMFKPEYNEFIKKIIWVYLCVQNFIPTILLVLLNSLLVFQVRRQLNRMKDARNQGKTSTKDSGISREMHVTIMGTTISVAFVVLTLPMAIFIIFRHGQWEYWATRDEMHTYTVVNSIVYFMYDLNHVINVFLYFISGKKFRSDAAAVLCCCRKKRRAGTSMTNSSIATGATTLRTISSPVTQATSVSAVD